MIIKQSQSIALRVRFVTGAEHKKVELINFIESQEEVKSHMPDHSPTASAHKLNARQN